ncbi:MAG: DUF4147 domain-containing protein [Pyrinomonadaceae bacterium]|nr:DUF4147 domain-containing protein [Pyrinomonadaceae bacterium]
MMETDLRRAAREIFEATLKSVDASDAVRRAVRLEGSRLTIQETMFDLDARGARIYALAVGKAAFPMAIALDEILGKKISKGLIIAPENLDWFHELFFPPKKFTTPWRFCDGAHPLPKRSSFIAAQNSFKLLQRAHDEQAIVIFLISGGGSAMIEWPRDEQIKLGDIRTANRALISCGASIAEINAVRRAFSAVKGGGLAARAPGADQVSLIVSDTGKGLESIVASGLTYDTPVDAPDAASVIARYELAERLPASILRAVNHSEDIPTLTSRQGLRKHYVLLDNDAALEAAAAEARGRGFRVEIARDISEQPIAEGCAEMLSRIFGMRAGAAAGEIVCLISGGEFACPVRGEGIGGRNAETALRGAIEMAECIKQTSGGANLSRVFILSAGTDGIDGNSLAAGAVADETTIKRAAARNLNAQSFLDKSDAYSFFETLGDAIVTGATGTNVRDLRIMLAV